MIGTLARRTAMIGAALVGLVAATPALADGLDLPRESVDLVAPPFVHAHEQATRQKPKVVEFRMVVEEKEIVLDAQGTRLQAMTFEAQSPARSWWVVHEGDYVELTLVNPKTNKMPHNVDFHAATGGLGGGELTLINPGEQTVLRFKATRARVYFSTIARRVGT
jgi:nitrite reductase (NO-forming)